MVRRWIRLGGVLVGSLVLCSVVWGCRAKIAGDEYIIGPFPASSPQEHQDRDRNLQSPAPENKKSDEKGKDEKP